jgi:hypothetical protein
VSNSSAVEGSLGRQSLKKVKVARRASWALVERVPKIAPKAPFSAAFSQVQRLIGFYFLPWVPGGTRQLARTYSTMGRSAANQPTMFYYNSSYNGL